MPGERHVLHSGLVGEIRGSIEARDRRSGRAAASVDEDFFAFGQIISDLELMRGNKTSMAVIEAKVGALVDLFLPTAAKAENDFVFLRNNFGEIDADIRSIDAPEIGRASCRE